MSIVETIVLANGAVAIRHVPSGEIMHRGTGPAVEPREIYVDPSRLGARLEMPGDPLVLLDVGLGAGSNALAAWRISESLPLTARRLVILSFDNDLSSLELALRPENAASFGYHLPDAKLAAATLLADGRHDTARTTWRLVPGDCIAAFDKLEPEMADVVYWDIYSREVCPTVWTARAFRSLRRVCRAGATFHTYSAATPTRSGLLLAGFAVGRGPATGAKGETTMAATDPSLLPEPLDARWLIRLQRSSSPFPSDVPADAASREALVEKIRWMPQFGWG
ncbi:MAG: queuine tRNA-ribosyltransferase [Labilithrix sp.]|nr:queuine tRNA-ribosyltransferase [Labilithrix sp.]